MTPQAVPERIVGPALLELDAIQASAGRIRIYFEVIDRDSQQERGRRVGIDTQDLKIGCLFMAPGYVGHEDVPRGATISQGLLAMAKNHGHRKLRFETLDLQTSKSPKTAKELREIVLTALVEAFGQPLPPPDELEAATKAYRQTIREQETRKRNKRKADKEYYQKLREAEKERHEAGIQEQIGGPVTDITTFLKALELRTDPAKITKALKMLKAEKFQLFNDVTSTHLSGVVKSQTDRELVYACRIDSSGGYCCCTQNLAICGGLRGGICKHLLVLIIGLVKAEQLDPATVDTWVANTYGGRARLDRDTMSEIFIRYKGAEAGEIDWRPTETMPEDYYAL